jgi:hypothetical protein
MATFVDPLTGETRELNYRGIKCPRTPDPEVTEAPVLDFFRELVEGSGSGGVRMCDIHPARRSVERLTARDVGFAQFPPSPFSEEFARLQADILRQFWVAIGADRITSS